VTLFPVTQPVIVVVGPTGIGKTGLSLEIAGALDCEIVSMDSMQVYRYMDIGTAKATKQEREIIPHHLIDIVDPDEEYDAERFVTDACKAIESIHGRKKIPLITGGTGLYLRALTQGLFADGGRYPKIRAELKARLELEGSSKLHEELNLCDRISAERIHKNDTHRLVRALEIYYGSGVPWSRHILQQNRETKPKRFSKILLIGLSCRREFLYEQINKRSETMIAAGLEAEVKELLERGYGPGLKSMMSIGYRHMVMYVDGVWDRLQTKQFLARDTRRYAKRQFTWFRKTDDIIWFDKTEWENILDYTTEWLKKCF
jgi:tRNA dimethylallyltransferase